jgi:hypothetical protein
MSLSHLKTDPARRTGENPDGRYKPGVIANLPLRSRRSPYLHGGHEVAVIREQFPHFVEISGGFAELVGGINHE